MADEPTPAPADAGQADPVAPDSGTSGIPEDLSFDEKFDPQTLPDELQPAWKHMHGKFTQSQQGLASERKQWESEQQQYQQDLQLLNSLRNDPETQLQVLRELAQQHGYEIDEPNPEQGEDQQFLDPRVDDLLAERQAEQEQAWADQVEEQIYSGLDEVAQKDGVDLNDKEREVLLRYVTMSPLVTDSRGQPSPDIQGAYEVLKEIGEVGVKRYVDSKNAPSLPPTGRSGSREIDYSDPKARRKLGAAIIARDS